MQSRLPSRSRLALLALAAAASLAVAGCGGDDDTTATTAGVSGATGASGTPLSQDEFASQANAICSDVNDQLRGLEAPTNDLDSIAAFTKEGLAIVEPALQQFQTITPPEDLQSTWDQYLSSAQQQIDLDKQLQAAAEAGDTEQVKSLIKQVQALNNDALAKKLGLDTCAEETTPQG